MRDEEFDELCNDTFMHDLSLARQIAPASFLTLDQRIARGYCNGEISEEKEKQMHYFNLEKTDHPYIIKYTEVEIENLSSTLKL